MCLPREQIARRSSALAVSVKGVGACPRQCKATVKPRASSASRSGAVSRTTKGAP